MYGHFDRFHYSNAFEIAFYVFSNLQKKLGMSVSSAKLEKSIAKAPIKKLWKNGVKAIEEHQLKGRSEPFASLKKGLPSLNEIVEKGWNDGTTAVISFIDKNSGRIYTATLGDSEANIYRKIDKKVKSIPLSCVRDWSSKKEAKRAAAVTNDPAKATQWPKAKNPKTLRFPSPNYGLNVSRAIGDVEFSKGVIHKAKVTVNQVQPGDRIVIACDGLKDFVPEKEIVDMVKSNPGAGLAQKLVDHALGPKMSQDNVTVLVLNVD